MYFKIFPNIILKLRKLSLSGSYLVILMLSMYNLCTFYTLSLTGHFSPLVKNKLKYKCSS